MLVYLVSIITGALVGFLGSKMFKGKGWGVIGNSIAAAFGGIIGNHYLANFFHSLENIYIVNSLPAAFGACITLMIVMFIFNHDTGSD